MSSSASGQSQSQGRSAVGWLAIAGIIVVAAVFVWTRLEERQARSEFRYAVDRAVHARVNGVPIDDPSILLTALRQVDHVEPHHSHPMTAIRIDLDDAETHVVIARDSANSTEFWAFWPVDSIGRAIMTYERGTADFPGRRAGRIVSEDLDMLLRRRGL